MVLKAGLLQDFAPYARLLSARGAGLYFASQLLTLVGAAVFELGAIWFTLRVTESPFVTAVVAASAFLPALVSPFAGLVSDLASPKRVMVGVDVARSVLAVALGGFVWLAGFPPAAVIVVVSLVLGLLTRMYVPARFAWLGSGVPDDTLAHANALSTIVSNLRLPLGGLVAAVFFALDDPALVFLSSGLFYAVSWVLLLGLPTPPAERSRDGARRSGRSLDQAPQVLKDPRLSASLGFVAGSNVLLVGAWIVGSPILAEQIAPESGLYAFMQAAYGLGVVAGSLLVASLSARSVAMRRVISGGYVVRALAFAGLVLAGSRLEATVGALLLGVATPALTVTFPTVLQRLSRVIGSAGTIFGLYGLANAGAISVSIMVYGLVATYLSPPGMFIVPATASLVAAILVYQLVVLRFVSGSGEASVSGSVEKA